MARPRGRPHPRVEQTLAALSARCPSFSSATARTGILRPFSRPMDWGAILRTTKTPAAQNLPRADNIALVAERNSLRRPLYIGDTQGDYERRLQGGRPHSIRLRLRAH